MSASIYINSLNNLEIGQTLEGTLELVTFQQRVNFEIVELGERFEDYRGDCIPATVLLEGNAEVAPPVRLRLSFMSYIDQLNS